MISWQAIVSPAVRTFFVGICDAHWHGLCLVRIWECKIPGAVLWRYTFVYVLGGLVYMLYACIFFLLMPIRCKTERRSSRRETEPNLQYLFHASFASLSRFPPFGSTRSNHGCHLTGCNSHMLAGESCYFVTDVSPCVGKPKLRSTVRGHVPSAAILFLILPLNLRFSSNLVRDRHHRKGSMQGGKCVCPEFQKTRRARHLVAAHTPTKNLEAIRLMTGVC